MLHVSPEPMSAEEAMTDLRVPDGCYVAMAEWGNCKRCGRHQDLRMGSCFKCSDRVAGVDIPGGSRLWDMDNPENTWTVMTQ